MFKSKMILSEENPADGPKATKKAKHESKFLSLLEDVLDLDRPHTTHADISPQEAANKEIQKYHCIDANQEENPTIW